MSSTVTSSTIAAVLNMASANPDRAAALAATLVATLTFLLVVVHKEILSASSSGRWAAASRAVNVAFIPLLFGFLMIFGARLVEINTH